MRFGIVAAGGRLGGKLAVEAANRGHDVTAIINHSPCMEPRATVLQKSLFDLTREDVAGFDVLFSAYGSGFSAPAEINRQAMNQLAALVKDTPIRLIAIAGAGVLFTDESKTTRVWEQPSHPEFLKGISSNTALGIEDVLATSGLHYTFVSPGVIFDGDGPSTRDYLIATNGCVLKNEDGSSYTSYDDLACAMLDLAETGGYDKTQVTVVSRHGGPAM